MKRDIALVIDLEATCWKGRPPKGMHNEIIEIGISGVNFKTKEVVLKDTIIVKPEHSEISDFCTELTTLTQEFIDEHGVSFAEACEILEKKYKSRDRIWFSWGMYDKNQFERDCKLKGVRNPFHRTHFNIKPMFSFTYGIGTDLGVSQALKHMKMSFEGTAHRGGDDAYNVARIINKMYTPFLDDPNHKKEDGLKKDHEKLVDHLRSHYTEEEIDENVERLIKKTTPANPNKSGR